MPPTFQREGIDACKEMRKRHPGTGVVILSQFDDPDYAIALLRDGAAGYAYLLKDRIAEGDQLAAAIRAVATGGSVLDPTIVDAMIRPAVRTASSTPTRRELLEMVAEGKPIKAIAAVRRTTPAAVDQRRRAALRHAGRGRVGRHPRRARAAPPAARGDRDTRGAGRVALAPAAGRRRRALRRRGPSDRGDRKAQRHRRDVRHPRLLVDRRARRPDARWQRS